jgi:hypothetical protein
LDIGGDELSCVAKQAGSSSRGEKKCQKKKKGVGQEEDGKAASAHDSIQFNAMSGDARIVSQGWVEGVDILRMSRDMEIKIQHMKRRQAVKRYYYIMIVIAVKPVCSRRGCKAELS